MTKLSPNFSLAEFTVSDTAKRLGIANTPTAEHLVRLRMVALSMEHVRRLLGDGAIIITSAYRNPAVNKAVRGTPDSDHPEAWAVDFRHATLSPLQVAHIIRDSCLAFDQLILESGRKIVHLSFAPRLRREVQHQPGPANTQFFKGLPALK